MLAPNASPYTGPGTNSYVVAGKNRACVVDPGPLNEAHLTLLSRLAGERGGLEAILLTHQHVDHSEGAARLRELTRVPILASDHADTSLADRMLSDGDVIDVGGRDLRILYTPGHRFDHVCFLLEDNGDLFAGDMVAGAGTVLIAPPEGDLSDYLASLQRLMALDLTRIWPGHGPAIDSPLERLAGYMAHRAQREQEVLAGLSAGAETTDALVSRIYPDLDPTLRLAANLTLTAHLLKLERDGLATRGRLAGEERWRPI